MGANDEEEAETIKIANEIYHIHNLNCFSLN